MHSLHKKNYAPALTDDVAARGVCLNTRELARLAVVDGVGRHQERQQAQVSAQLGKGNLLQLRPGAVWIIEREGGGGVERAG